MPGFPKRQLAALALILSLLAGSLPELVSPRLVLGNPGDERPTTVLVELEQPPLASRVSGGSGRGNRSAGEGKKLDLDSSEAQTYLSTIEEDHRGFVEALSRALPAASVKRRFKIAFNGFAITIPASKIPRLRRMPGVKQVTPTRKFHPALDVSVPLINAPAVWSSLGGVSQAGLGKKIAVLDTGIDQTHPFLTDNSLAPPPGFPKGDPNYVTGKVIVAKLYAPPGTTPEQGATLNIEHGHGTHVAGIAAGISNLTALDPSTGTTKVISGVAPKAFLMNYKVLLGTGGDGETAEIIQAIDDAVADGADVVNMSFGGPPDLVADEPFFTAIRNGTRAGVVFVAAAGNNGSGLGTLLSPGTSPDVITVGASSKSDVLASFSSRGPSSDLSIKPEVTAPGVSIFSSLPASQFGSLSGTSMATPHVVGAVALLKQLYPTWTPAQVKSALITTAKTPVYRSFPTEATVMERGGGRIDLQQAMDPGLVFDSPSFSFGIVNVAPDGAISRKSFSATDVSGVGGTWSITVTQVTTSTGLQVYAPAATIYTPPNGTASFSVILSGTVSVAPGDYEGFISLQRGSKVLRIPYFVRIVYFPYISRLPLIVRNAGLP